MALPTVKTKKKGLGAEKIESRPTGTDVSRNVDITNLTPAQSTAVSEKNAREGQAIQQFSAQAAMARVQQKALEDEATRQGLMKPTQQPLPGTQPLQPPQVPQVTQTPTEQPKKENKGILQKVAETALVPAAGVGNLIGQAAGAVTGQPFTPSTVGELGQTTFGKVLGGATAGAGAALVGGLAAEPAVEPALASVLRTTAARVSLKSAVHTALTAGGISVAVNRIVNSEGSILSTGLSEKEKIIEEVKTGRTTYTQALDTFNQIDANINDAERTAKRVASVDVLGFMGVKDTLTKFEMARRTTNPSLNQQLFEASQNARLQQAKLNFGQPLQ